MVLPLGIYIYVKYESSITYHSKAMAILKVFADKQTDQRTGQKLYAPDLSIRGHKNRVRQRNKSPEMSSELGTAVKGNGKRFDGLPSAISNEQMSRRCTALCYNRCGLTLH